jgi:hypothetical protein
MPIAARVVGWTGVTTTITYIKMATEAGRAACCHRRERAPLFGSNHGMRRKPMTVPTSDLANVILWSVGAPSMER